MSRKSLKKDSVGWVSILMGSKSDWPVMRSATDILDSFSIKYQVIISSAHRTPDATVAHVKEAEVAGCAAFICGAGMAAHLAGAVAAHTIRPVIGVPLESGGLGGLDALLSTVQMPGGIPVAAVAVGKAGATNAAYLAAQILALENPKLAAALQEKRSRNAVSIAEQNLSLQQDIRDEASPNCS